MASILFIIYVYSWFISLYYHFRYQFPSLYHTWKLKLPINSAGAHRRTGSTSVQKTFRLKQLFKHEQFSMRQLRNDIALLQLDSSISASSKVNTVCLPSSGSRIPAGTQCYITGNKTAYYFIIILSSCTQLTFNF